MKSTRQDSPKIPTLIRNLRSYSDRITRIAWSPKGQILGIPSASGLIRLWNIKTGSLQELVGHSDQVNEVAFIEDGKYAISVSDDMTLRIWNVNLAKAVGTLQSSMPIKPGQTSWHKEGIWSIAITPSGLEAVTAQGNSNRIVLKKWNLHTGKCDQTRPVMNARGRISTVRILPNSSTVVFSTDIAQSIHFWDMQTDTHQQLVSNRFKSTFGVGMLATTSDGKYIAVAAHSNILVWDTESFQLLKVLDKHTDTVTSLSFSHDASYLASKAKDGLIYIWNCHNWAPVMMIPEPVADDPPINPTILNLALSSVAFHPQLPILATLGAKDTKVRVWHLNNY